MMSPNLFLSAAHLAFLLASRYFLLTFSSFHSVHSLCFSLTLLLLSFKHHDSLSVVRLLVHSQLPSVSSSKAPVKTIHKPSTEESAWLPCLYLLIYELKSLFTLSSCSFHIFLIGTLSLCLSIFSFLSHMRMAYAEWYTLY